MGLLHQRRKDIIQRFFERKIKKMRKNVKNKPQTEICPVNILRSCVLLVSLHRKSASGYLCRATHTLKGLNVAYTFGV